MAIPAEERTILRDLAKQVAEIAALPRQRETAELWYKLNRMERTRPLIMLHDGTGHETGDKIQCVCKDDFARGQEYDLRSRIYAWEHMRDDRVWEPTVRSWISHGTTGWGIDQKATRPDHKFGAAHFNTVIGDDDPATRIPMPTCTVDWEATERNAQQLAELYDGILTVELAGQNIYWYAPIDLFITLRGIEQTFIDMVDRPEWVHSWFERALQFSLSQMEQFEKLGVLTLNNRNQGTGPGGLGYTNELPKPGFDGKHVRICDLWGHATTQIFSEVSPAMHEEFALQYEGRFLARYGIGSYGCCEPLHNKVDIIFKHIPHCRRISMSPKADIAKGVEAIGKKAIFSWKPNPAMIGMEKWDGEMVRRELRDAFEKTRGCVVEVIMKDLHTCRGEPKRMWEWVRIAKELSEEFA